MRARGDKTVFPRVNPGLSPGLNGAKLRAVWVVSRPRRQLTKEGQARRLTYCCGRTGCLNTTSIPVCPPF